jgi:putative exporter of polyketide antibiotics
VGGGGRTALAVRYADLALLGLALPVFLLAGWPLLGYAVAAAAWLAQRWIQIAALRRVMRAQQRGDRRAALGTMAGATLGRVWLIALAVLLVGLVEREAGLAAALLSAALFTVYLGTEFATRLLGDDEGSR